MPSKKGNRAFIKHSRTQFNLVMPEQESEDALKELTGNGFKLLCYYYSRKDGWFFNDEETADAIGIKTRTLQDTTRKELVNKKFLKIIKGQRDIYLIGRKEVVKDDEAE